MARGGYSSSIYLERTSPIVTSSPFSLSLWGKTASPSTTAIAFAMADTSSTDEIWEIGCGISGSKLTWRTRASGGPIADTHSTNNISSNTWFHAAAVEAATSDHRVFLNGSKDTTSTDVGTPTSLNNTIIGALKASSVIAPWGGDIAHVAIWSAALSDGEVAALAKGYSPLYIRPSSLLAYWPLDTAAPASGANEQNLITGAAMTASANGLTKTSNPTFIPYQRRGGVYVPAAAASGRVFALAGLGGGLVYKARGLAA